MFGTPRHPAGVLRTALSRLLAASWRGRLCLWKPHCFYSGPYSISDALPVLLPRWLLPQAWCPKSPACSHVTPVPKSPRAFLPLQNSIYLLNLILNARTLWFHVKTQAHFKRRCLVREPFRGTADCRPGRGSKGNIELSPGSVTTPSHGSEQCLPCFSHLSVLQDHPESPSKDADFLAPWMISYLESSGMLNRPKSQVTTLLVFKVEQI